RLESLVQVVDDYGHVADPVKRIQPALAQRLIERGPGGVRRDRLSDVRVLGDLRVPRVQLLGQLIPLLIQPPSRCSLLGRQSGTPLEIFLLGTSPRGDGA